MPESPNNQLSQVLNLVIAVLIVGALGLLIYLGVRRWTGTPRAAEPDRTNAVQNQPVGPAADGIATKWTDRPLAQMVQPEIRIDKSDNVLTVFDIGLPVKSYRVQVGTVVGDKEVRGDQKTPEGEFYVCIKQGRGETRFTRALGLNYPNAEDAKRGLAAGLISRKEYDRIVYEIDRGRQPPWDTALGGEILIHGESDRTGGTLGCIRLTDPDILELFPAIPVSTRVVIQP